MVYNRIKEDLSKIVLSACKDVVSKDFDETILIEKTKNSDHGDYACNIAMILSKKLHENPVAIAERIAEAMPKVIIEKIEVRKPGFINLFLKKDYLIESFESTLMENSSYLMPDIGKKEKIVIEYSQPNVAKPLGVHHLLSTIIGQSLVNLYEYLNYDVTKVNHIGDWGTQFGKLIFAYKKWGDRDVIDKNPIQELLKLYILCHSKAEENEELDGLARQEFKKLEEGDEENTKLWKWIRDISLSEVKNTYRKLEGITFSDQDYVGESFYNDKMDEILERGKTEGVFKLSEGAYIAEIGENEPPLLVQKSDGTTLYATRDLAQVKYRTSLGIVKN